MCLSYSCEFPFIITDLDYGVADAPSLFAENLVF